MNYLLDTNIVLLCIQASPLVKRIENDLVLVTTDHDFTHLDETYLSLEGVDIEHYRKA